MHGNAPHDGPAPTAPPGLDRGELRRATTAVTTTARKLLPDAFVVGSEIVADEDGLRATVAVQPPAGSVVSASVAPGEAEELARELAAGAALELKRAGEVSRRAR